MAAAFASLLACGFSTHSTGICVATPGGRTSGVKQSPARIIKQPIAQLGDREQILVLTKADVLAPEERNELIADLERASGASVLAISAVSGEGLSQLVGRVWRSLSERPTIDESKQASPWPEE